MTAINWSSRTGRPTVAPGCPPGHHDAIKCSPVAWATMPYIGVQEGYGDVPPTEQRRCAWCGTTMSVPLAIEVPEAAYVPAHRLIETRDRALAMAASPMLAETTRWLFREAAEALQARIDGERLVA